MRAFILPCSIIDNGTLDATSIKGWFKMNRPLLVCMVLIIQGWVCATQLIREPEKPSAEILHKINNLPIALTHWVCKQCLFDYPLNPSLKVAFYYIPMRNSLHNYLKYLYFIDNPTTLPVFCAIVYLLSFNLNSKIAN